MPLAANDGLPDTFLEAMGGVAYWTDPDGVIRGGGVRNWTRSANENRAPSLQFGGVVGRNLFDFIDGEMVRAAYRQIATTVMHQDRSYTSFTFHCHGPLARRNMLMSVGAIRSGDECIGVLYHSMLVEETRPTDQPGFPSDVRTDARPLIKVCSFCQNLRKGQNWMTVQAYFEAGGPAEVHMDHDVCPECLDKFAVL